MLRIRLFICAVLLIICSSAIAPPAHAVPVTTPVPTTPALTDPTPTPATLFEQNCAACHANGGNIIRRGKNLKQKAMKRNGYDSVDAIAQIITHGKGIMSAYGDRLNEAEISAIAQYVHTQSATNWK